MEYWSSSESNGDILEILSQTSRSVTQQLVHALGDGSLAAFDIKLRYIPIIMTADRRARYPARSRVERKNRIYNCCPQLDYDAFVSGTPVERVAIYLDGLRGCGPGLAKLGATPEQVAEFDRILDDTLQIVTERLNQSTQT